MRPQMNPMEFFKKYDLDDDMKKTVQHMLNKTKGVMPRKEQIESIKKVVEKKLAEGKIELAPGYKQYQEFEEAKLTKTTEEFINITDLKQQVFEILLPVVNQTKDLFRLAQSNDRNLKEYQQSVREMHRDVKRHTEKFEQMQVVNNKINEIQLSYKRLDDKMGALRKSVQIDHLTLEQKLLSLDKQLKTNHLQITECHKHCQQMEEAIDDNFNKYCVDLIQKKDQEQRELIQDMEFKIAEFKKSTDLRELQYKKISINVTKQMEKTLEEVYTKHKQEMTKLERQVETINDVKTLRRQVNVMEPRLKGLCAQVEQIQDVPQFIERSLPIFTLLQISDFIRNIFAKGHPRDIERGFANYQIQGTSSLSVPAHSQMSNAGAKSSQMEAYQAGRLSGIANIGNPVIANKIFDYESKKIKEICEHNANHSFGILDITRLNNRLQNLAQNYQSHNSGLLPFTFGKDYTNDMLDDDMDQLNSKLLKNQKDFHDLMHMQNTNFTRSLDLFDRYMAHKQQSPDEPFPLIEMKELQDLLRNFHPSQLHMFQTYALSKMVDTDTFDQALWDLATNSQMKNVEKAKRPTSSIMRKHVQGANYGNNRLSPGNDRNPHSRKASMDRKHKGNLGSQLSSRNIDGKQIDVGGSALGKGPSKLGSNFERTMIQSKQNSNLSGISKLSDEAKSVMPMQFRVHEESDIREDDNSDMASRNIVLDPTKFKRSSTFARPAPQLNIHVVTRKEVKAMWRKIRRNPLCKKIKKLEKKIDDLEDAALDFNSLANSTFAAPQPSHVPKSGPNSIHHAGTHPRNSMNSISPAMRATVQTMNATALKKIEEIQNMHKLSRVKSKDTTSPAKQSGSNRIKETATIGRESVKKSLTLQKKSSSSKFSSRVESPIRIGPDDETLYLNTKQNIVESEVVENSRTMLSQTSKKPSLMQRQSLLIQQKPMKQFKKQTKSALAKFQEIGNKVRLDLAVKKQSKVQEFLNSRPFHSKSATGQFTELQMLEIQEMIDSSVDWLQGYLQHSLKAEIDTLKQKFIILRGDAVKWQTTNQQGLEENDRKIDMYFGLIKDAENTFKHDQAQLKLFKQRLHSDIQQDMNKILEVVKESYKTITTNKEIQVNQQAMVAMLVENAFIDSILMGQDIKERKPLGLFSLKQGTSTPAGAAISTKAASQKLHFDSAGSQAGLSSNTQTNRGGSKAVKKLREQITRSSLPSTAGFKSRQAMKTLELTSNDCPTRHLIKGESLHLASYASMDDKATIEVTSGGEPFLLKSGAEHENVQKKRAGKQGYEAFVGFPASPVKYNNQTYTQTELVEIKERMLEHCKKKVGQQARLLDVKNEALINQDIVLKKINLNFNFGNLGLDQGTLNREDQKSKDTIEDFFNVDYFERFRSSDPLLDKAINPTNESSKFSRHELIPSIEKADIVVKEWNLQKKGSRYDESSRRSARGGSSWFQQLGQWQQHNLQALPMKRLDLGDNQDIEILDSQRQKMKSEMGVRNRRTGGQRRSIQF